MNNVKTTGLGLLQLVGAAGFVLFKMSHEMAITDAEAGLVMLALTSGIKGVVSADAKPTAPTAPAAAPPPPEEPK